jgi:hypothetical protein
VKRLVGVSELSRMAVFVTSISFILVFFTTTHNEGTFFRERVGCVPVVERWLNIIINLKQERRAVMK